MLNVNLLWLSWVGASILLVLLVIASYSSKSRKKKIVYAVLAIVNIIPFPIFGTHETIVFPAWALAWMLLVIKMYFTL